MIFQSAPVIWVTFNDEIIKNIYVNDKHTYPVMRQDFSATVEI